MTSSQLYCPNIPFVLPEHTFGVDGETVDSCFDNGDGDGAGDGVDVAPVLVCGGIFDVVLKIDAVMSEDCEGLDGAVGEVHFGYEC